MEDLEKRKYPIGSYAKPDQITPDMIAASIARMESLPIRLTKLVMDMTPEQLSNSYREGGWTGRQIVHHIADSHVNGYIRLKLALTAEHPTIAPYDENQWAEIDEAKNGEVEIPLALIAAIHARLVNTLKRTAYNDFKRTYYHPQYDRMVPLDEFLSLYAWHGDHHMAQLSVICELYPTTIPQSESR